VGRRAVTERRRDQVAHALWGSPRTATYASIADDRRVIVETPTAGRHLSPASTASRARATSPRTAA
jgi:hypothetical protein